METSPKALIASALLKSQREIQNVKPDSTNPRFGSGYASLAAVIGAVKTILNSNDIVVIQNPIEGKDGLGCLALETILMHVSGEQISSICVVPLAKGDPQAYGSALTYARRYSLASMTGLATDDDDAESATPKIDPRVKAQMDATGYPSDSGVQSTVQTTKPPTAVNQTPKKGSWRDARCPVGKNKGLALGELKNGQIKWYYENFTANVKFHDSMEFRAALDEWRVEMDQKKGREEEADQHQREAYQDTHLQEDEIPF